MPYVAVAVSTDRARAQRRTVTVLFGAQILGGVGVALGITVGTLLAQNITGSPDLAGFAQTAAVLGAATVVAPIARISAARGRRAGLAFGYLVATVGALLVVLAGTLRLYPLLLFGMLAFGAGTATGMQARYAATDLATSRRRGTALSTVVWATTLGAVAGPNLAEPAGGLARGLGVPGLAGPFVLAAAGFLLGCVVVLVLLRPDPLLAARAGEPSGAAADGRGPDRSLRAAFGAIRRSRGAALGLVAAATAHATMIAVMALTPVHMGQHGATLQVIGFVISGHVAGMYALSPLVGWLSDRFGRVTVILAGQGVLLGSLLLAGTAPAGAQGVLGLGLFLLGLGWSCGMVAGSTLLTESVPAEDRPLAQGAADSIIAFSGAAGSAAAGVVVGLAGYGALNAITALLPISVLILLARARRRAPRPPPEAARTAA